MSKALQVTRNAMLLWLFACGLLGASSIALGFLAAGGRGPAPSVEEVLAQSDEMTAEEALGLVESDGLGLAGGGAFVASLGVFGSTLLCALGMIPLSALFLYLRGKDESPDSIQAMPKRPRVPISEAEAAASQAESEGEESDGPGPETDSRPDVGPSSSAAA